MKAASPPTILPYVIRSHGDAAAWYPRMRMLVRRWMSRSRVAHRRAREATRSPTAPARRRDPSAHAESPREGEALGLGRRPGGRRSMRWPSRGEARPAGARGDVREGTSRARARRSSEAAYKAAGSPVLSSPAGV
jgi:hypothetical protein